MFNNCHRGSATTNATRLKDLPKSRNGKAKVGNSEGALRLMESGLSGKMERTERENYRIAFGLAVFTIVFNIAEGLVSTYFGYEDGSLALFGFGADSFIEVVSGLALPT